MITQIKNYLLIGGKGSSIEELSTSSTLYAGLRIEIEGRDLWTISGIFTFDEICDSTSGSAAFKWILEWVLSWIVDPLLIGKFYKWKL